MRLIKKTLRSTTMALVLASAPLAQPASALTGSQHRETAVDNSRFLYVDATSANIHLKVSNGWRLDPWHVEAHVIFLLHGKEIGRVNAHIWCPASLGGHAKECEINIPVSRSDLWAIADDIAVSGNTEAPRGRPLTPDWSISLTFPSP